MTWDIILYTKQLDYDVCTSVRVQSEYNYNYTIEIHLL